MPLPAERFQLRKSPSVKNPWLVEDTHADPAEDAVLYHFPTKKKAEAFKAMMDGEFSTSDRGKDMNHRFEVAGIACGVQSCDSTEANVFFCVDSVCTYARMVLGEFEFNGRTADTAKEFFTTNKSAFMAKVTELSA